MKTEPYTSPKYENLCSNRTRLNRIHFELSLLASCIRLENKTTHTLTHIQGYRPGVRLIPKCTRNLHVPCNRDALDRLFCECDVYGCMCMCMALLYMCVLLYNRQEGISELCRKLVAFHDCGYKVYIHTYTIALI